MAMKSFVRKKSATRMAIDTTTTVRVVLSPTPSVPPVVRRPKCQPTMEMMNPKKGVFMRPLMKSLRRIDSSDDWMKKFGVMSN